MYTQRILYNLWNYKKYVIDAIIKIIWKIFVLYYYNQHVLFLDKYIVTLFSLVWSTQDHRFT